MFGDVPLAAGDAGAAAAPVVPAFVGIPLYPFSPPMSAPVDGNL